jgi:hypothetical protein
MPKYRNVSVTPGDSALQNLVTFAYATGPWS